MMAGRKNAERAEQKRARRYAARTAWHEGQIRRRARDNTIVGIAGGLIVVGAMVSQFAHAQVTAPEPTPTPSPSPSPSETTAPLDPLLPNTTPEPTTPPAE
ncbi:hypothetical protein OED01_07930 [Microbacterium sp. M28]|uniref:hypothetical protein n=1 Tax=Microbacterium sp. M28 TaxID=2962064 RepID=UPI0021F4A207|nr:hypothetical protein [Microbacterium sp. M28]UYO98618.1 hypothetical protein OED01_07930 [Microbacterium sp. M28]